MTDQEDQVNPDRNEETTGREATGDPAPLVPTYEDAIEPRETALDAPKEEAREGLPGEFDNATTANAEAENTDADANTAATVDAEAGADNQDASADAEGGEASANADGSEASAEGGDGAVIENGGGGGGDTALTDESGKTVRRGAQTRRIPDSGVVVDEEGNQTHVATPKQSMGDALRQLLELLRILFTDFEMFPFAVKEAYPESRNIIRPAERKRTFETSSTAVRDGAIERARESGRITYRTPDGEDLNIPVGERQGKVIAAIDKVTGGDTVKAQLLQSFWGAESRFGTMLRSPTTAWGDFQFTQGTWADTVNRRGTQMIAEMRRDGYNAQADTLQGFIDRGEVGASLRTHRSFLELRDEPIISTYAAHHLIELKSEVIGADPGNIEDWGRIYMAYTTGEATVQLFDLVAKENPNQNIVQRIMTMSLEETGLSATAFRQVKDSIRHNMGLWDDGRQTAADIEAAYTNRIAGHGANFEKTFDNNDGPG